MREIVVAFRSLGPYHVDQLNALSAELRGDWRVVGMGVGQGLRIHNWQRDHLTVEFDERVLFPGKLADDVGSVECGRAVWSFLEARSPAAVLLSGYDSIFSRAATLWARWRGRRCLLLFDTTARDQDRVWWKEDAKRSVLRLFDGALVSGRRAAAYLQSLGWHNKPLQDGADVVNVRRVRASVEAARRRRGEECLSGGCPYLLCVARLSSEKNHLGLLRAYSAYRSWMVELRASPADLVLAGDGPLRGNVARRIEELRLVGVRMAGYLAEPEIWDAYAGAMGAVLTSTSESWGLVVNEAMAAGLPVVVSQYCGCVPDLVRHGSNGLVVDPTDWRDIASGLALISSLGESGRSVMGTRGYQIIRAWDVGRFAAGVRRLLS